VEGSATVVTPLLPSKALSLMVMVEVPQLNDTDVKLEQEAKALSPTLVTVDGMVRTPKLMQL